MAGLLNQPPQQYPFTPEQLMQVSGKYQAGQSFGDLGAQIPQILQFYQQEKNKKQIQDLLSGMVSQQSPQGPVQGPQLAGQGMMGGAPAPASGMGSMPPQPPNQSGNQGKLLGLMAQIDPFGAGKMALGGQDQMTLYMDPKTNTLSATPSQGFMPYGKVDRESGIKMLQSQSQKQQTIDEQRRRDSDTKDYRDTITNIQKQNEADRAADREENRRLREQIQNQNAAQRDEGMDLRTDIANANHGILNPIRSMFGMGPLVQRKTRSGGNNDPLGILGQ